MSDTKKYYYMRLKEDFFEDENMILLESMDDGYLYVNILLKLYLRSLKSNGRLMLKGLVPYNANMIAKITRHQIGTVERCLKILRQLNFVEILEDGTIYMSEIQNFIGTSSTEADRKREYRNAINAHKLSLEQKSGHLSDICPDNSPPEINSIENNSLIVNNPPKSPQGEEETCPKATTETAMDLLKEKGFPPDLEKAVKEWTIYKNEKRQGYKPMGFKSLLSQIEKKSSAYGKDAVIEVIYLSMGQNWQGIAWGQINAKHRSMEKPTPGKSGGGEYTFSKDELEESIWAD